MSSAFKCDRCGEYAEPSEPLSRPLWFGYLRNTDVDKPFERKEFCESCAKSFERWLEPPAKEAPLKQHNFDAGVMGGSCRTCGWSMQSGQWRPCR